MNNTLNVVFSSDDNYVQHLSVALLSVLTYNSLHFSKIVIYVIENDISDINKERIEILFQDFENSRIVWIPFMEQKEKLLLNMPWNISVSSYARLFVGSMLPQEVERVLYMDCDMVMCSSLENLWNQDLGTNIIGAVQDFVPDEIKTSVRLLPTDCYFNAGFLLIDLGKWRERQIEDMCLSFISEYNGKVIHHDQGVLNGVLRNNWEKISVGYNVMTVHYFFNRKKLKKYYNDHSDYYSIIEVENAKNNPIVLHYTPSFTSRPWNKGCKHPCSNKYWDMLKQTPWKDEKPVKNSVKWYIKLIEWRYRCLPY